jgi:hypothetical protein
VVDDYVLIDWVAPFNGGTAITGYRIYIRQTDGGVYTQDLVTCNGASGVIIAATACQVPLTTLTTAPYSLSLGATVDVKLIAYNAYGDSAFSSVGTGANIVGLPDAPVSLQNDPSVTSALKIGLLWEDGASDNGKPIEDYMIEYDQSTGVWT